METLERDLEALETSFHRAYWESQVDANDANDRRRQELELEVRRAKGDPETFAAIKAAAESPTHDPVLRRQLHVLLLSLTANQMDEEIRARIVELSSSVESDFASFRPLFNGRRLSENDVDELLDNATDDAMRRGVWEASKEVGSLVADRVRELARLRNEAARTLGYADYYRMSLELQELDESLLFGAMDDLEHMTEDTFVVWKEALDDRLRQRFGVTELYPWHYADPFFQSLPRDAKVALDDLLGEASAAELAKRTFAAWDIDLSGVLGASDLYPRERKCQHAFCLDVDRSARDVRILANTVPGERWIEIMLHEAGHAAYDVSIDAQLPYFLRRPAHTFVTEAIALLSGRVVRDPRWLADIAKVPEAEVRPIADGLVTATASQSLLFTRWGLVMVHFERELYSDPEADLNGRWWELVGRFQRVKPPDGRSQPDWAAKIHIASSPVYYHNYLLGDMLASHLRAAITQECGGLIGVPDAGRFLVDRIFRPGALLRWDALIEEATGRPLSPAAFAADVAAAG